MRIFWKIVIALLVMNIVVNVLANLGIIKMDSVIPEGEA